MKITSIVLMNVLIASLLVLPLVFAEDNLTANDSNATSINLISANPNETSISNSESDLNESENVGNFRMGWMKFETWLTFNQEKKAEKELLLAKLQLIKAKIAAKNNNTEAMEKALDAHEKLMEKVNATMNKLSKINQSSEKLRGLERAIQVHEMRITKLQDILANENLSEEKRIKVEAKIAHATEITDHLSGVKFKFEEKIQNRTEEFRNIIEEAKAKNTTVKELAAQKAKEAREAKRANQTQSEDNETESEDNESESN